MREGSEPLAEKDLGQLCAVLRFLYCKVVVGLQ